MAIGGWCRADADMFLAMAYAKTGQNGAARDALQRTIKLLEANPPGSVDLGSTFQDWIMCDFVRHEAESVIAREDKSNS